MNDGRLAERMDEEQPRRNAPRWRRRVVWAVAGVAGLVILGNVLAPDLAMVGRERIALVRIEGPILNSRATVDEVKAYGDDPLVKAIVLRIDSPGGGVAPSQEIYHAVRRVREDNGKTVVASMGSVAASGGYYIAAASDHILANPGTLTGSIGVIMQLANVETLMDNIGVKNIVIKSGRYKDTGSPFRPMADEDRRVLQSVMDDAHRQFIEAVADGRSLDVADVERLADGRVLTGQQAKDARLVDELGGLHAAVTRAAAMSGLTGVPPVVETPRQFSFRDWLIGSLFGHAPAWPMHTGMTLMYLMAL